MINQSINQSEYCIESCTNNKKPGWVEEGYSDEEVWLNITWDWLFVLSLFASCRGFPKRKEAPSIGGWATEGRSCRCPPAAVALIVRSRSPSCCYSWTSSYSSTSELLLCLAIEADGAGMVPHEPWSIKRSCHPVPSQQDDNSSATRNQIIFISFPYIAYTKGTWLQLYQNLTPSRAQWIH